MWTWIGEEVQAEKEGKMTERKMFLPLLNLYKEYPELEHALESKLAVTR